MTTANVVQRNRESWIVSNFDILKNVFANTIHLDVTNGNAANKGTGPRDAVATIKQALALSSVWDTLLFAPGTYPVDVGDAAVAPLTHQEWRAAVPSYGGAPSVIIVADADDDVTTPIAVDVDGVSFHDIELKLVAGGTTALFILDAAQTNAVRGLTFRNCWINLNGVDAATIGLRFNDATNAITGLVMTNCRLIGATAVASIARLIQVGVGGIPDALIEHNIFAIQSADGDAIAIDFIDPGAAVKSYANTIRYNDFIGPADGGGDGAPIVFAAAMTEDEIVGMMRNNFFSNCVAQPITIDSYNNSIINNYVGDDATGGTLVDPGT